MSSILILSVGKSTKEYRPLFDHWVKMIKYNIIEKELVCKKTLSPDNLKIEESKVIRQNILKNSILIVLDPLGKQITSEYFSTIINNNFESSKDITFIIGGAYGLDNAIKLDADIMISLSAMTMPHLLAKLLLIEQIYRAQTILTGHPYHK